MGGGGLRLDMNAVDYLILALYFVTVLGVGFAARRAIRTSVDFFLSGRSLPAWVTGLAFVSANLGALEIIGMAANGAQYGIMTVHYYWIGAVPAMVFLGIVMMPFYYGSKVRSVPEYLRLRFNRPTHLLNAISFAVAQVLIAGVNLYALALIMQALLGWPLWFAIIVGAVIVLAYITVGGLSGAIYNEVLQFFVIIAGLVPITVIGLIKVGGVSGLMDAVRDSRLGEAGLHAWEGTGSTGNPLGAHWLGIVFGLGFVLSFGYWTTNFAEVQRALSARNMSAARRTPIIAAYPKLLIPAVTVIPGLIALVTVKGLGADDGDLVYNNAIPLLMRDLLPNGVLGIAVTGLVASFMAGMAANVSGFNTVFTYDIWQAYFRRNESDEHYVKVGRLATVGAVVIGIGTAFIAAGFSNIMNYIQALFSVFNAPLFGTFIIGMFWRRMTPLAGFWSLLSGTLVATATYLLYKGGVISFNSDLEESFWGAGLAFATVAVVAAIVTPLTRPKTDDQLTGLVYGLSDTALADDSLAGDAAWYRSPVLLGVVAVILAALFYIPVF
ncbi:MULTISPECIES: sodium:solute symporter family protein [unclassified Micromonospora]|uniref:sodium:solute symporter family protein n=1 Tax=unclassified Micromonospora TaxID=2617518 RepID=UPI0003EEB86D|nr:MULTISPECIES: sodium:solute symporter family protein [unclassified Micromonospora]EWM67914.1 sodium:solute symporter [Micromonospora sp. M42]MCK1805413.1 sodium:solute symporter family protein [Micromonospora sp. R42106]MCK1830727.1 sodium:solute symporter family protein [Micromonospora sp. R42003]MCK1842393.1 sodium:solute symporter family protein [Micromonospora sp. R42004]MCM1017642.1 sodium:solute symporter family protein [Micromonospora sp. XM-20-01]